MILVTGGAGFIGSHFVRDWRRCGGAPVVNLDSLTYAGNLRNLTALADDAAYIFVQGDIRDGALITQLLDQFKPESIVNLAAETHVDRSIAGPANFVQTNVVGFSTLLEAARQYWSRLAAPQKLSFRFVNVSTDEVFGSLGPSDKPTTEADPYRPSNPYSASKAAGDHLAQAYFLTYGFPVITTNSTNNFGTCQYPEKLIPRFVDKALRGEHLPLFGDGMQVRDWLHVLDHCDALRAVLASGKPGEKFNIGAANPLSNRTVAEAICRHLDAIAPKPDRTSYNMQIKYVTDRSGHDRRYSLDASKIRRELGWQASRDFEDGLRETVEWNVAQREHENRRIVLAHGS